MPVSDEPLDHVAKTMVTKSVANKITKDTRPGRKQADVLRDAIDFYFEYRDRIIGGSPPRYRSRAKNPP